MNTRRILWLVIEVLIILALTSAVVWAASEGAPPGEEDTSSDVLWTTLAPIIAIATFTERVLEMFWAQWEKKGAWPNRDGVANTADPTYVGRKKVASQWIGTGIAIVAIGLTNVRFFRLLGFDVLFSSPNLQLFDLSVGGIFDQFTVGTLIDWLMTAGIIGWGGTELVHNIIEGLIKGRNLWKEMREVESGRRSITEARFFNDYIAPELEKRGVSVASLRQVIQSLDEAGVPVDAFIGSMTVGKADELITRLEADTRTSAAGQAIRDLLDRVPPTKRAEIPNILNLLTPELRQRFLGA